MGTRHLIAIVVDNEIKVAQYNQWDGYPSGQGVKILSILREGLSESFKDKVRACSWLTEEDIEEINKHDDWSDKWPWLSRDCSSNIFKYIEDSEGLKLLDRRNFAGDSLFCEWGYVVDLDNSTLEVYSGFNKESVSAGERFADVERDNKDFYPIRLKKIYKFDALPDNVTFCSELNPTDED